MPIDYSEYHPKWLLISKLIRFNRAGNKCEHCGIVNGSVVRRLKTGWQNICSVDWDMIKSKVKNGYSKMGAIKHLGFTKIVLTVAHLDHNKENNDFSNLAALCQKCHLSHDIKHHVNNRKYGRNHKGKHQLKLEL